jgi:hypothetical protein
MYITVCSSGLNTRPSSAANRLRSVVEDANNSQLKRETFRKNALRGAFYSKTIALTEWKPTSFKLIVFISSTFTDTQLERNFLMDELYFELRKKGFAHNIQVILMDMRWGIQDEMTLDHKTWIECARGIDWCIANSTGIAFLSLQGDKFGYTPLPKSILQADLDAHLQHCPEGKHFLCCIIRSLTLSIKTSTVWRVTGIALMIMLYRRSMFSGI